MQHADTLAKLRFKTFEVENRRLADIRGGLDWGYLFFSEEAQEVARYLDYEEADVVTGAVVHIVDGDYGQLWLTTSRKPYLNDARYARIVRRQLPDWYHGQVGKNEYVAKAWFAGLPARSNNGFLHTDGENLYSFKMKIGRTFEERKQVLNAWGFSPTTTEHVNIAERVVGYADAAIITPVQVKDDHKTVVGRSRLIRKDYWLYFPDEVPNTASGQTQAAVNELVCGASGRPKYPILPPRNPEPPENDYYANETLARWLDAADDRYEDERDSRDFE